MSRLVARRRSGGVYGSLMRFAPLSSMVGLGALTLSAEAYPLTVLFGIGAILAGRRLLDRQGRARRELWRQARANAAELMRVARADGIAAPPMKRVARVQGGLLESWEILPGEYGPLLLEDLYTVVGEVEVSAQLARRRSALRRHLESVDRRAIVGRIRELEREISGLEEGSALRASFEAALEGRRGELEAHEQIPGAIGMINAQLEGIESLLGNLRGELLALDASPTALAAQLRLVGLKRRISCFRRSLDEVKRSVDYLPKSPSEGLARPLPERMPVR